MRILLFYELLLNFHSLCPQLSCRDCFAGGSSPCAILEIDCDKIDFTPIFEMAADLFTYLGVACMCYQTAEHEVPNNFSY